MIYSKRLVGPVLLDTSTTSAIVGTVPAGKVWIVRTVLLWQQTAAGSATIVMSIGDHNVQANRFWSVVMTQPVPLTYDWRLVLTAGETLRAYRNPGFTVSLTVSGYELSA